MPRQKGVPAFSHLARVDCTTFIQHVYAQLQRHFDATTTRAIGELERSSILDIHKVAKRCKLRLRLELFRPLRTRLTLNEALEASVALQLDHVHIEVGIMQGCPLGGG